jgi:hypothetical protein
MAVEGELPAGEKLLWAGRPKHGLLFRRFEFLLMPVTLLLGGLAFFLGHLVMTGPGPLLFRLLGIPLFAAGFFAVFGRFLSDARRRRHTFYGLTDRGVIIVSGHPRPVAKRLTARALGEIVLHEHRDGRGTITFGGARPERHQGLPPMLEWIGDARAVFDLISAAQGRAWLEERWPDVVRSLVFKLALTEDPDLSALEAPAEAPVLSGVNDAALLAQSCLSRGVNALLLHPANLTPRFFDQASGEAAAILGTLMKSGIRMAVICPPGSPRLGGTIGESASREGAGGDFGQFETRETARDWLARR